MSLNIGDAPPAFHLANANTAVGGSQMSLEQAFSRNGLVVAFECNHCPYVVASVSRMNAMAEFCQQNEIGYVGINSNDPLVYENDSFANMEKRALKGMPCAYLHDSEQDIAHAYGAERTPEFFLFNSQHQLVYKGRMDDSPRDPSDVMVRDLDQAIAAMLNGTAPDVPVTQSIGCSVKWKSR
jgi:hypothetical protein